MVLPAPAGADGAISPAVAKVGAKVRVRVILPDGVTLQAGAGAISPVAVKAKVGVTLLAVAKVEAKVRTGPCRPTVPSRAGVIRPRVNDPETTPRL